MPRVPCIDELQLGLDGTVNTAVQCVSASHASKSSSISCPLRRCLSARAGTQAAAERLACQVGPAQRPGVWRPEGPAAQCLAEVPLGFEVQGEWRRRSWGVERKASGTGLGCNTDGEEAS